MSPNKYLTSEEQERLEASCSLKTRNELIILLALRTGARETELLNVKRSDLQNNGVYIRGIKGSNDRFLPLKKDMIQALQTLTAGEILFDISSRRLRQIWAHYSPNEKSFHSLRHTYAVNLYQKTKDLLLVQYALGHKDIKSTMVYATVVDAVAKLKRAAV